MRSRLKPDHFPKEARAWAIVDIRNKIVGGAIAEVRAELVPHVKTGERIHRVKIIAIA